MIYPSTDFLHWVVALCVIARPLPCLIAYPAIRELLFTSSAVVAASTGMFVLHFAF